MEHVSIPQWFDSIVYGMGESTAYRWKDGGQWRELDWNGARERVRRIGRALIALGVGKGDKVNILAQTRLEWVLLDLGIAHAGGVTVGIYPSTLAEDCQYIIDHSDGQWIFVENEDQLNVLQRLDCTYVQGLLFGDPMSADNYLELLLAQADGTLATVEKFGGMLGLDGIHFTDTGYGYMANLFIARINEELGADLAPVDLDALWEDDPERPDRLEAEGLDIGACE